MNRDIDPEFVSRTDDGLAVRLHLGIYGADAIARAAHRFTDRCYIHLDNDGEEYLLCRLKAKRPGDDLSSLAGEFANEVLDQTLRARIAAETEQTRLLLLAHAFSNTNILHPELDEEEPESDPVRIAEPDSTKGHST